MGSISSETEKPSQKNDQDLLAKLQPYQEKVSEQFGVIRILKLNQRPSRYYMHYRETGINEEKSRARLQQKLAWYLQLKEHKNIVSIEHAEIKPSISLFYSALDMCIQKLSLDLYAKYYNYTLDMAVQNKLKKFLRFKEADLIYIMVSMLSVGQAFTAMVPNQPCGWFKLTNIYITPQGFVKVYPFPLHCDLKPINGIQRSGESPHKHTKSFLENEEVVLNLSRKTSDSNNNSAITRRQSEKSDLRDIGLVIFQLLILNQEIVEIKLYPVEKISSILSLVQKEGNISSHFKEILLNLILNYCEVKYSQLLDIIANKKEKGEIGISNSIKLDEGSSILQSGIFEKKETLKQLSQHKHLKAGCISIVSSRKSQHQKG